ncbi:hypothetical protein ACOMHN_002664 [Nucella lapillus]
MCSVYINLHIFLPPPTTIHIFMQLPTVCNVTRSTEEFPITCAVCLANYRDPRFLPCHQHSVVLVSKRWVLTSLGFQSSPLQSSPLQS